MKIEIRNRFTGSTLFEGEFDNIRLAVEAAVKAGNNLTVADLSGANLTNAYLSETNLTRADLGGAN
jgi:uncharacterized protein YjbI with pentapeptide repeats